ncbi:hypothetical protein FEV09_14900 [Pseudanabaena catenata USMAC16]|uniref:Uncharacterized protein n=1 Tax=Pseudanabaena catenata USMAC16 TaxID=1855837 RepID=A0A9X4RIZ9_9CYAN|nr:hypothetical protein [Pseudanabaena catenata]MDG3495837.1 hypothetical protein [Pseudanabaena catenata USMAC16]
MPSYLGVNNRFIAHQRTPLKGALFDRIGEYVVTNRDFMSEF